MQICDQLNRQKPQQLQPQQFINSGPGPTSSGFISNNLPNQHFQPQIQQQFQTQAQAPMIGTQFYFIAELAQF